MTTWTTIHLPTVLHFHPGSLATNQHFNLKLLTLSKGWCLFESTSTQGLICHIKEWHRVSWVDSTAKGTRLNGRRKYFYCSQLREVKYLFYILTIVRMVFCRRKNPSGRSKRLKTPFIWPRKSQRRTQSFTKFWKKLRLTGILLTQKQFFKSEMK